jgi:hypothetical protein
MLHLGPIAASYNVLGAKQCFPAKLALSTRSFLTFNQPINPTSPHSSMTTLPTRSVIGSSEEPNKRQGEIRKGYGCSKDVAEANFTD